MSNRYAHAMGLGFCFRSVKERNWYIDMFNGKVEPLVKKFNSQPKISVGDLVGINLGITSKATRHLLGTGIKLRRVRAHEPEAPNRWMTECYAEEARMEHKIINVLLVDHEWYVSEHFMYYEEYKFVAHCLLRNAMSGDELDEDKLRDSLVTALIASGMNDKLVESIDTELDGVDALGIRTLADFEIALNDNSL